MVAKYDLLWKFYEKYGQFINAARVLSRLADTHSTAINLAMRVEYPSRAIVCTRVAETSSFGNAVQGQFLYELEEKMDGAEVQSQVLEAVSRFHRTDQQDQQDLVTSVWQCNANCELKKLRNVDPESKLSTLGSKMKTLDRLFTQSKQFFSHWNFSSILWRRYRSGGTARPALLISFHHAVWSSYG